MSDTADLERELKFTKKQLNAVLILLRSKEMQLETLAKNSRMCLEAISTLQSEREANEILTNEVEALSARLAEMEKLIEHHLS